MSRPAVSDRSCRSLPSGSLRALLHRSSALRSSLLSQGVFTTMASADCSSGSHHRRSPWVSNMTFTSCRRALPTAFRATIGLRCRLPAHPRFRPHCPFVFLQSKFCLRPFRADSSRSQPGLRLRLASPPPSGTSHPDSYVTCQAHKRRRRYRSAGALHRGGGSFSVGERPVKGKFESHRASFWRLSVVLSLCRSRLVNFFGVG